MSVNSKKRNITNAGPVELRFCYSLMFFVGAIVLIEILLDINSHSRPISEPGRDFGRGIASVAADLVACMASLLFIVTVGPCGYMRGRYRFSHLPCAALAFAAGAMWGILLLASFSVSLHGGLWLSCLFLLSVLFGYLYVLAIQHPWSDQPQCPKCGYLLYHVIEHRCPECGRPFSLKEIVTSNAVVDDQGVLRPRSEASACRQEEQV